MARAQKRTNRRSAAERAVLSSATRLRPRYGIHLIVAGLTGLLGVGTGAGLAYYFGHWLEPAPPHAISTVGRIETVRMPIGARTLRDVKTFVLTGGGGDDFGRVYVNNYLVISNEDPNGVLLPGGSTDKGTREKVLEKTVDRADFMMTAKDVRGFLRKGQNYIIQDLLGTLLGGRKVPWVILGPCFRHPSGEVMDRNSELQRRSQRFLMAMAPSYATTSLAQNDGSFGGGGRSHSG